MNERLAFIRAICANPADDTVRLAFADWLDEHDEPLLAEFVRVQVELSHIHEPEYLTIGRILPSDEANQYPAGVCPKCSETVRCRYHTLYTRQQELWTNLEAHILSFLREVSLEDEQALRFTYDIASQRV